MKLASKPVSLCADSVARKRVTDTAVVYKSRRKQMDRQVMNFPGTTTPLSESWK